MKYDNPTIKDMRKRIITYGLKRGLRLELAEEMAQDWLINKVLKNRGQRFEHAYADKMRLEHSRNPAYQKHHYESLVEERAGSYVLPEIYTIDCNPKRLRKKMGTEKVKLLRLMARGFKFTQRCKKMHMTSFQVHHLQLEIRQEINAIFQTKYAIHRTEK